jgi:hypothetical protein
MIFESSIFTPLLIYAVCVPMQLERLAWQGRAYNVPANGMAERSFFARHGSWICHAMREERFVFCNQNTAQAAHTSVFLGRTGKKGL